MVETSIAILFCAVFVASLLTLVDCWVRGRYVFDGLQRERALIEAGFVEMQCNAEPRLRERVRFETLAAPARTPAHRTVDRARLTAPQQEGRKARLPCAA